MSDPPASASPLEASAIRTSEGFLALATRRARAHDPAFPDLARLPLGVAEGYGHVTSHGAWRDADRGANLSLTSAESGPAEEWSAACWGAGWGFWLRYDARPGRAPRCWQEPFSPTP